MQNIGNLKKDVKAARFILRPVETRCVHNRVLPQGFYQISCEKLIQNDICDISGWSRPRKANYKMVKISNAGSPVHLAQYIQ